METVNKWKLAESLYRSADSHKPSDQRFEKWSVAQRVAYLQWEEQHLDRMLLFFPTGQGKSKTSLALMYVSGIKRVVVIAPPRTHGSWKQDAAILGIELRIESHQKFRMKNTMYKSDDAFIVDEFHLLGGHGGQGWKKLNRMAKRLTTPIIMASATPNYNDAERVYCITSIGRKEPSRDYLTWLYNECNTIPNPFRITPDVDEDKPFKNIDGGALEYLIAEPYTAYVEDDAVWTPVDLVVQADTPSYFEELNYSKRTHRVMASDMEKRHARIGLQLIDDQRWIREEVHLAVLKAMENFPDRKKWLIFANHKTVAVAAAQTFRHKQNIFLITGDTTPDGAQAALSGFKNMDHGLLIGTSSMATGVDGIDKHCQSMIILDDVDDPSLRRQLIGRILPRGVDDGIERVVITVKIQ